MLLENLDIITALAYIHSGTQPRDSGPNDRLPSEFCAPLVVKVVAYTLGYAQKAFSSKTNSR